MGSGIAYRVRAALCNAVTTCQISKTRAAASRKLIPGIKCRFRRNKSGAEVYFGYRGRAGWAFVKRGAARCAGSPERSRAILIAVLPSVRRRTTPHSDSHEWPAPYPGTSSCRHDAPRSICRDSLSRDGSVLALPQNPFSFFDFPVRRTGLR
jgi:hypothetical protein